MLKYFQRLLINTHRLFQPLCTGRALAQLCQRIAQIVLRGCPFKRYHFPFAFLQRLLINSHSLLQMLQSLLAGTQTYQSTGIIALDSCPL